MRSINNLVAIVLLLTVALASAEIKDKGWWNHTVFYQIYPRSVMDSNGDGVGDLKGITSKMDHFRDLGVGAIWLSPIYKSPMVDFGYDIEDFLEVDPIFGTSADFKELVDKAHQLGLKVVLDLVPNHTADKHKWFQLSLNRTGKYGDYYIWNDGKKDATGNLQPPNNWLSVFNGSGWEYNDQRKQYYFHQFYKQQPDLNYANPDVQEEMENVLKYWLDQGVDGFRIDAVPHLFENHVDRDEPSIDPSNPNPTDHASLNHTLTKDQPQTYTLVESWRKYVDEYADKRNQSEKVILTEAYTSWENTIKYYNYGSHVPFNFKLITNVNAESSAQNFSSVVNQWIQMTPKGMVPNWVVGNHDRVRVFTRFPGRGEQLIMLEMMLPGVAVTYYGEEIGMVDDTSLLFRDFRDGCRTPMQWDDSDNAGFSTTKNKTWLPVNSNYKELNLKKQKTDSDSYYKLYKELIIMRKSDLLRTGDLRTTVLNENVFAVLRNNSEEAMVLLLNFSSDKNATVDLSKLVPYSSVSLYLSNVGSKVAKSTNFATSKISIPPKGSLLLHGKSGASSRASYSVLVILTVALGTFFR